METVNLKIPNMKSMHCQLTVTNTLKNMGASLKRIEPAHAEIELKNGLTREAVIKAIEKAGYKVVE
jgi:copper chaperone CopZ